MMETMYTLLGTSQQPKLLNTSNDCLFVVSRKPLTPLPTISAESHPKTTGDAGGNRTVSSKSRDSLTNTDKKMTFEAGKRVNKRNGTAAITVKVMLQGSQSEQVSLGRIGSEVRSSRPRIPLMRTDNRKSDRLEGIQQEDHFGGTENEQRHVDSNWTSQRSFSQVNIVGGKRERELEDNHGNCMHPHVTRVDILFKPLSNSEETGEDIEPTTLPRRRHPVKRQVTKQTSFGSKESVSLSTSNILVKPNKPDSYNERDELNESTETTSTEGTWDSAAYTAKNTRIEFARTLHVPRPCVLRKDGRWSMMRKPQEKTRICSRHLQHTRPIPRHLPSPHLKDNIGCPNQLRDPWLVTPTQRRFVPARPLALTNREPKYFLDITDLRHKGILIGPSHPHLHLAAINSVYNRLSISVTDTPPVSEADSLEFLDDFEAFNLKVKMEQLINKFKQLPAD